MISDGTTNFSEDGVGPSGKGKGSRVGRATRSVQGKKRQE